jgi:DNA-damage-inducible protein J
MSTFVRARVDTKIKEEASEVLAELGLTISDLVRMALTRVARDRAVPPELKVPNAETQAAMREARELRR